MREGIVKSGPLGRRSLREVEGVRAGSAPPFEVQVVLLADRLAAALHDLDDALQAGVVDVARVERLQAVGELKKKLGPDYPARAARFTKANAIHRGLIHLLVTGAIMASARSLKRWAESHGIETAQRFAELRDEAVKGSEVTLPPSGLRMLDDIGGFLEAQVYRGRGADEVEAQGRRVLLGLFAAYHADPTLLDDHVLLRFKEIAGGRFLRDLPRQAVEAELSGRYRKDPRFVQVVADHLAAMTDPFALHEHRRLAGIGAVPIPGAEQLKRERT